MRPKPTPPPLIDIKLSPMSPLQRILAWGVVGGGIGYFISRILQ